jgi:hypothetical protein
MRRIDFWVEAGLKLRVETKMPASSSCSRALKARRPSTVTASVRRLTWTLSRGGFVPSEFPRGYAKLATATFLGVERLTKPIAGPTGRENPAQGRGRRPTPWVNGHTSGRPERPRELPLDRPADSCWSHRRHGAITLQNLRPSHLLDERSRTNPA